MGRQARPERVAVATMLFEANTFCPEPTRLDDFYLTESGDLFERLRDSNTEIWGMVEVLQGAGMEVLPGLDARAASGGTVEKASYLELKKRICDSILQYDDLDAVSLSLHGAMAAEEFDDAEGVLLEELRAALPADVPIVVSFDLHANVTEKKVQNADAIVGFETYPHIDMGETGRRAARVLVRILREGVRPTMALAKLPVIVPPENQQTTHGAAHEILHVAKKLESMKTGVSASVFSVQPWMDIAEMGSSVLAVTDNDAPLAREVADETARFYWSKRTEFTPELLSPEAAIRRALEVESGPVVLGESSDGIGSGSPGDSNEILKALLAYAPDVSAGIYIVDPEVAARAVELGAGTTFTGEVGGKLDTQNHSPVTIKAQIESVYDPGGFTFTGPCMTGVRMNMERAAVLRVGDIRVLVSERKVFCHDQEIYRSAGIVPEEMKILVAKSPNMFRAVFGPIAKEVIMVDTPGVSSSHLARMPFKRINRPLWPLDEFEVEPRLFESGSAPDS